MTTTLLKHEWLRTRGSLGMLFGILTLVVLLGGLLGVSGWPLLYVLGLLLAVLGVFALVPATQLLLAVDYWRSGYGRTGYFTQSIPVRGSTIYWAKLGWAIIASLVALVLTVLLALFTWWAMIMQEALNVPGFGAIGEMWSTITEVAPVWMIVAGVVLVLASFLAWPIYYYFAVSVGHESRLAGLGAAGPILVFVLLYIGNQVVSFIGMAVVPFGIGVQDESLVLETFDVFGQMATGAGAGAGNMPVGYLVPMGLLIAFCAWRTARSWNRNVALT